jgi:hypothetical protein
VIKGCNIQLLLGVVLLMNKLQLPGVQVIQAQAIAFHEWGLFI